MKQWTTGLFGSVFLGALTLMLSGGCGSNERAEYQPRTIEADRAQGEAILMRMSKRLASAQVLAFSTTEVSERERKDGDRVKLKFTSQLVLRRPDRLWFRLSAIAIGTMLTRPPAASTTVVVGGSTYWYHDNVYYSRVYSGGSVAYQVVGPPVGAIIRTLPVGCTTARVGAVVYQRCGATYYQPVSNGYRIVVLH